MRLRFLLTRNTAAHLKSGIRRVWPLPQSGGRKTEAVEILETAVRAGFGSAELHNSLGPIYAESGRMDEARDQFNRALQINPNFTPAQNNLRRAISQ